MVWVGSGGGRPSNDYNVGSSHETMWSPSSSIATPQKFSVDFDVVIKHIKELNILAGEGSSEVTRTSNGAQLKVRMYVDTLLCLLWYGHHYRF